jgi:PBP1b-binding outer membrane lipoprotein LpoB
MKHVIRIAGAVCLALLLSGCVIEPAWGPYHHHHHWDRY